jgi:serine/threonine protein kinase
MERRRLAEDWLRNACATMTPVASLLAHLAPSIAHYAAPEIIQGQLYGVEVDVWSCGAILYVFV